LTRAKIVASAAAAAALTLGAPVGATTAAFLHVTNSPVQRGRRVIIRGNAAQCAIGNAVTIISKAFAHTHDFAGQPAVFARVRRGGRFGIRPRVLAAPRGGTYKITARCGGGNLGVSAFVTVL
jgi:hypothetical protein